MDFNPRAPCGARLPCPQCGQYIELFQSTRPVRGATNPRMGRLHDQPISIHAPRAGRDETGLIFTGVISIFQSTRPVRGATGAQ